MVLTSEEMVYHAQNTPWGERVSAKLNAKSKQRKQLDSFHLLHIVFYLQKGGGGNKGMNHPGTTENNFHLWHQTRSFSSMRSIKNKLVEHLWQARWTNKAFGFQDMKNWILMLKIINMTQTINRKRPPSNMNKKEGSALVYPRLKLRMGR